jgi:hypothetical protein
LPPSVLCRIAKYALLRASAATSSISRLFDESASIRRTFVAIGEASRALGVFLDREEHADDGSRYEQLFPERRSAVIEYDASEDSLRDPWSHVDQLCSLLLAAEPENR